MLPRQELQRTSEMIQGICLTRHLTEAMLRPILIVLLCWPLCNNWTPQDIHSLGTWQHVVQE